MEPTGRGQPMNLYKNLTTVNLKGANHAGTEGTDPEGRLSQGSHLHPCCLPLLSLSGADVQAKGGHIPLLTGGQQDPHGMAERGGAATHGSPHTYGPPLPEPLRLCTSTHSHVDQLQMWVSPTNSRHGPRRSASPTSSSSFGGSIAALGEATLLEQPHYKPIDEAVRSCSGQIRIKSKREESGKNPY